MRSTIVLLAVASLSACNQPAERAGASEQTEQAAKAVPAALTFEGAAATDPDRQLAHGKRLSHVLGCTGCHAATLEGQLFNDDAPELGKLYASNLTRILPAISDAQLEALLRTGRHPTRGNLWVMPSEVYQRLSQADMAALILHLRKVRPSGAPTPPPALSALAKAEIAKGRFKPVADHVSEFRTRTPADLGPDHAWGRYVTGVTCAECHGADLSGVKDFSPGLDVPDLNIAGAYGDAELARLLTTGEGKVRKDLGLMSLVGKGHFSHLTPRERDAIIAYLKARATRPQ